MLGAGEIRRLMAEHGLDADRRLGQNFVTDPNVVRRIVALAGVGPGDQVLEIGPGLGSLTVALAEAGASVTAVEKDPSLLPVLEEVLGEVNDSAGGPPPMVVAGDALDIDWDGFLEQHASGAGGAWTVVANLPYNVAVPIICGLLEGATDVESMWVMMQLEVAERICATPGGRDIGVPSIRVGWFASASVAMTVSPEVFTPKPRVRSAVLEMHRRQPPETAIAARDVFDLVGRAYRQRRKMLRSSLGREVPSEVFDAAGIDPRSRPEELSVKDWGRLAVALG